MNEWLEFDNYAIYNIEKGIYVEWMTYGDNDEYFLSKEYYFRGDDFLNHEEESHVLVNEIIDNNNTFTSLVNKTKEMVIYEI